MYENKLTLNSLPFTIHRTEFKFEVTELNARAKTIQLIDEDI